MAPRASARSVTPRTAASGGATGALLSKVLGAVLERVRTAHLRPLSTLAALRERYADDFEGFCLLLRVPHALTGEAIPLALTPLQAEINRARTGRDFLLKSRQIYATSLELARDVWYWLTRPGVAVRVVCQTVKDRAIFVDLSKRLALMIGALQDQGLHLELDAKATGRWLLSTGQGGAVLELMEAGASKASAGNKGRGGTTQRLHCTEVAFWHLAATTLRSLLKTVHGQAGDGTEITFESTPCGVSVDGFGDSFDAPGGPWFHEQWRKAVDGTSGYTPFFAPWYRHGTYRLPLDPGEVIDPADQPIPERRAREEQLVEAGVDQEQLKWFRAEVARSGQNTTDQEYPSDPESCFLLSGRSFFDKDRTIALLADAQRVQVAEERKILRPGASGTLRIFKAPIKGHRYLLVADTSGGEGGDPAAVLVYDVSALCEHVATLWGQFKPRELGRLCAAIGMRYEWASVAVERNNTGVSTLDELERAGMVADMFGPEGLAELRDIAGFGGQGREEAFRRVLAWAQDRSRGQRPCYPRVWYDLDQKAGWWTGAGSRTDALNLLEQDHREGRWSTPDTWLLDEMRVFVVKSGRAAAQTGKTDDLVMAAAIGNAIVSRPPAPGAYRSIAAMPPG